MDVASKRQVKTFPLLPLLSQFIADCRKGYRVLPNATRKIIDARKVEAANSLSQFF
jgi:hypothetical protein